MAGTTVDGWMFFARLVKAAQEADIPLDKAIKFMALLSMEQEAKQAGAVEGPKGPQ